MEYGNLQAQEAAKRQEKLEEENLKDTRRGNYIVWFVAMGALISGFAALAVFFEKIW